jgi:hypothetical protein
MGTLLKCLQQGGIVLFEHEFAIIYVLLDLLLQDKPVSLMINSSFVMWPFLNDYLRTWV